MNAAGADESVIVGRFNSPWGVQGWVRVYSHTRPATTIFDYRPWLVGEHGEEVVVEDWQKAGPRLVARLRGIDSPEAAAALTHLDIRVPRASLPKAEAGSYYWHDLVGLEVVNLEGHVHGHVKSLLETGAHDVLEIVGKSPPPVLIPFVIDEFIREVDFASGRILVDWPLEWVVEKDA